MSTARGAVCHPGPVTRPSDVMLRSPLPPPAITAFFVKACGQTATPCVFFLFFFFRGIFFLMNLRRLKRNGACIVEIICNIWKLRYGMEVCGTRLHCIFIFKILVYFIVLRMHSWCMICMGLFRTFNQGRSSLIFCLVVVRKEKLLKILGSFDFDQLVCVCEGGGGGDFNF